MSRLKTVLAEIAGLFVDDGSFAVAILLWLAAVFLLARLPLAPLHLPQQAYGPILFVGLAAILLESAIRRARR